MTNRYLPVYYFYPSGKVNLESYYVNDKLHRVDGPARLVYFESGEIEFEAYYVNNVYLNHFDEYGKEKIFEYIAKYPEYINEIEILAKHNHWLNEEQLLLLRSLVLFNEPMPK